MQNDSSLQDSSIGEAILLTGTLFAFLVASIIYFVILYRNKQIKNKKEQELLQTAFHQELLKTQIEVQDQTLDYISSEIHDNITQVLSFVKLTLTSVNKGAENERLAKINESRELIAQAITDLRDLSKSLSYERITTLGLVQTIEKEAEKINKSKLLDVCFEKQGEIYSLGKQTELVLFRIFQETLNNTLKHAGAKHLKIILQYHSDLFNLTLEDDGCGFSKERLDNQGSGLKNIENRAAMIGGSAIIKTAPGQGCCISINLNPLKQHLYTNGGTHSDRLS